MTSSYTLEEVRTREPGFYMDSDQVSVPIDEKAALAAMNDPRAVDMKTLRRIHAQAEQRESRQNVERWSSMAADLPPIEEEKQVQVAQPVEAPKPVVLAKKRGPIVQTYADIAADLRNFKNLPQKTTLSKIQTCFFSDNRVYVTVTTVVVVILLLVVVIMLCLGASRK